MQARGTQPPDSQDPATALDGKAGSCSVLPVTTTATVSPQTAHGTPSYPNIRHVIQRTNMEYRVCVMSGEGVFHETKTSTTFAAGHILRGLRDAMPAKTQSTHDMLRRSALKLECKTTLNTPHLRQQLVKMPANWGDCPLTPKANSLHQRIW